MKRLWKKNSKTSEPQDVGRKPIAVHRPEPYTYHARRDSAERRLNRGDNKPKPKLTNGLHKIERFTIAGVSLVLIVSFLYLFWLDITPRVRITNHDNEAANILLKDTQDYEQEARKLFARSVLSRTKLTINTKTLEQDLLSKFPELESATITLPLTAQRPVVTVQPKVPNLIAASNGQQYVIDKDGVAMSRLSDVKSEVQPQLKSLPRVLDQSLLEYNVGAQVVTSDTVQFIQQMSYQYNEARIEIDRIELPQDKPNEIRITAKGDTYYVKYILDLPANEQFGVYRAVVEATTSDQIKNYIDVRVDGRAFYK